MFISHLRDPLFQPSQPGFWLLSSSCGFFALMTAIRLARFNTVDAGRKTRVFRGVPSTLCGAIIPSALLVVVEYSLPVEVARCLPVLLALLGLGMVSRLPVPKVVPRKSRWLNWFQCANVAATYVCGILTSLPEYILGLSLAYLLIGSVHELLRRSPRVGSVEPGPPNPEQRVLERIGDPD